MVGPDATVAVAIDGHGFSAFFVSLDGRRFYRARYFPSSYADALSLFAAGEGPHLSREELTGRYSRRLTLVPIGAA